MATTAAKTMYLAEILQRTRADVAARSTSADAQALEAAAALHTPRGFARALQAKAAAHGVAVIAELKKASPSKGLIRAEFDAAALAAEMEAAGAAVLSVLTDEPFFQGSLANLRGASAAASIPCLRKDFMVDPFQVVEARANGADAILLIVAALCDDDLRALREEARRWELDVLCEVHDADEVARAIALDCECIGVNARDLRTFEVSLQRACELADMLPKNVVRVAESGIQTADDVRRLRQAGFQAFLIGETLMRQASPGDALRAMLLDASAAAGE